MTGATILVLRALGVETAGGVCSAQLADALAAWICFAVALYSYLALGRRRCRPGRVALLVTCGLCLAHYVLDNIYEIVVAGCEDPMEQAFDHAWLWFEAAASCLVAAYVVLTHAVSADLFYERRWAEMDVIPRADVNALRRSRLYARRAGAVLLAMSMLALLQTSWEIHKI